jgi:Holliday junction DNA helicase RuvA
VIAYVRGEVTDTTPAAAVVDVGGVGLLVQCTPGTLATLRVGRTARVSTSMVVREDSLTLFGFVDDDERDVFELVQTASGVGPRLAQAILAVHGPDDLRRAVLAEDLVALTKVPGIGRKGAQRIVLELKDRIGAPTGSSSGTPRVAAPAADSWRTQVHGALVGLGWSSREADQAVDTVSAEASPDAGVEQVPTLLRSALQTLSKS